MGVTTGRIEREGVIKFGDASLHITEEGISEARARGGIKGANEWERQFKKQVFLRIVQQLNRLGWTCIVPPDYIEQYGLRFAQSRRECSKGDLKGFLDVSGRCIEFEMWQGVNTPTRPDHGGRYESDKEEVAPYLLRLEMYRTRSRIRDYLCNVFTGYTFIEKDLSSAKDPLSFFNAMWDGEYEKQRGIHRFSRGHDGWPDDSEIGSWDRNDADGNTLHHGDVRWSRDHKGRLQRGRVYGGINGMWIFVYGPGRESFTQRHHKEFFTFVNGVTPRKVSDGLRRRRLENELEKAVSTMNLERAAILRDLIFQKNEPLYVVWSNKHDSYHCSNFCGYTKSLTKAGKFTAQEVEDFGRGDKVIPIEQA